MSDERSLVVQWRDAPWTVKAYVALSVVAAIVYWLVADPDPWLIIGSILLNAFFIYGLVRGSKTVWVILLILEGFGVLLTVIRLVVGQDMAEGPTGYVWVDVPIQVLRLFLLLHPETRAWLRPQRATSAERLRKLAHPEE